MATFDEFWGRAGPGLLNLGVGLYDRNRAQKEAAQRLAAAQGPLYERAMGGAGATLAEAGTFNPDALAASRFGAQEAMLKPVQDKELADLQRLLYSKGMLGISNYNPGVEGVIPTGQPMNPQMVAFFAAQNADRAKRAQASLLEGQNYANTLVNRAGNLRGIAGGTQQTGLLGQATQPSRSAGTSEFLRGIIGIPGVSKGIGGMLSGLFGGSGGGDYTQGFAADDSWGGWW